MSALFKLAPPGGFGSSFNVPGVEGEVHPWRKAIAVGGEVKKDWQGQEVHETRPPLAPTRFAAQLEEKKFTNH